MRSFEERKAEVLKRSAEAIDKRKRANKRVITAVSMLVLCVCIFAGYSGMADIFVGPSKSDGEKVKVDNNDAENDSYGGGAPEISAPSLSVETVTLIKTQYAECLKAQGERHKDIAPSNISLTEYTVINNGAVVGMFSCDCCDYDQALWSETVAGVTIHYNDGQSYTVWYNGDFYSLTEAYAVSILTIENLRQIAEQTK